MKRSPMPPRAKRLSPRSKKREAESAGRAVTRAVVFARDRHRCQLAKAGREYGLDVGRCFGPPNAHHIRKAAQGGAYIESNLCLLCAHHNSELEANADLALFARSVGLVKMRGD